MIWPLPGEFQGEVNGEFQGFDGKGPALGRRFPVLGLTKLNKLKRLNLTSSPQSTTRSSCLQQPLAIREVISSVQLLEIHLKGDLRVTPRVLRWTWQLLMSNKVSSCVTLRLPSQTARKVYVLATQENQVRTVQAFCWMHSSRSAPKHHP